MRTVIEMEGGLIHSVISEEPLEVLVIDRDTEGIDEDEGMTLPDGERVFVQTMDAEEDELAVESIFDKANGGGEGFGAIDPKDDI